MTDRLVEILLKDCQNLRKLYKLNATKSHIAFYIIDNYIRWFEKDPNVKHIKLCSLNGNFSDGTFVVRDRYHAYADTLSDSYENLSRLLQLHHYRKGVIFSTVRTEVSSIIIDSMDHSTRDAAEIGKMLLCRLPKEEALKFDVRFPTGLIGVLQTDKDYLGRGYGSLVTKYLSKKVAEMGNDVYTAMYKKNVISQRLFSKLGFTSISEVDLIRTTLTWNEDDE